MGRTLPLECEHGNIIDWGDFGPDDGRLPACDQCERDGLRWRVRLARWLLRGVARSLRTKVDEQAARSVESLGESD